MKRNSYYDKVKGLAIVLVVIGHAIQSTGLDIDENVLFRLIYSFHMPLFMFISGLVTYREQGKYDFFWLKKRFLSLGVPFTVWIFIPYFLWKKSWHDLPENILLILKSPDYGLWFLWVLFLNCVLLFIVYSIVKIYEVKLHNKLLFEICIVVICVIVNFLGRYFWYLGVALLKTHCIYYFAGFIVSKHKNKLLEHKWIIAVFSIVIWIVMVPYWRRVDYPIIFDISYLPNIFKMHKNVTTKLFNFAVGFCGIGMVLSFVYVIRNLKLSGLFEKLGRCTIEIYILQWYFFYNFPIDNIIVLICVRVIAGLFGPYIVFEIYERNLERRLLYGKMSRKGTFIQLESHDNGSSGNNYQ